MIHNVLLITNDGSVVTRVRFWKIDFEEADIREFLVGHRDLVSTEGLANDTPIYVNRHKVFHAPVNDMILLFVTDGRDEDRVIRHKVREGANRLVTALRGNSISYIRDNLEDLLGELIFTRFKVSFVGTGGVGKSTLLRLLFGHDPAPGGYVPTINVAVDSSETIQFGTFLVTIWDFAGQAVFQDLWGFYFQGTDMIFLVTDSSFRNVMQTKSLLRKIKKDAPAVPLFIIANKQDLPESMRADKIQRLLGVSTFPMVATDKVRRDEFIRTMLEIAAKTVGVQLPDLPLSDMITVHRKTDAKDTPDALDVSKRAATPTGSGFEEVPYESISPSQIDVDVASSDAALQTSVTQMSAVSQQERSVSVSAGTATPARLLDISLLVRYENMLSPVFHLLYTNESVNVSSIAGVISALDSFRVTTDDFEQGTATDALETMEHEGNLVLVEKSSHFVIAAIVTNTSDEADRRAKMDSILLDIEAKYANIWETWDGETSLFEDAVFLVLDKIPMRRVSRDYEVRSRDVGKPLPFNSRSMGRVIVEVMSIVKENSTTVENIINTSQLPPQVVTGCLQILNRFGWVDFKVDIGPTSVPKKIGEVDEEIIKTYGDVIVKFVNYCDGSTTLEEIVKKVNLSLPAMRFVTTKLVLGGVLEIVG